MIRFSAEFLETLQNRGFINQITHESELNDLMSNKKITAYIGFDCTAKSLHIGSLIQIMVLRHLQKCGHQPIVLLGGATTKIGDPSGKDEARQIITDEIISENLSGIKKTLEKFDLSKNDKSLPSFKFVNNDEWLSNLQYIDFLGNFGRHFSINRMLTFDSVKLRLDREQPLSFLEFNYMILQAYDFYELNKKYGCALQIGGSDQWGNIVNGVELTRRMAVPDNKKSEVYGLTTPLLTTSDGKKMGKTANGAVWLDEQMLSPFEYYQFFRNIDDKDVRKFLHLFTDLSLEEISELEKSDINNQKKQLALEVTRICHGDNEAQKAEEKAIAIFTNKIFDEFVTSNTKLIDIICEVNAAPSKAEAKRLIKGKAVKIDNIIIEDENYVTTKLEFELAIGKKKFFKIKIKNTNE